MTRRRLPTGVRLRPDGYSIYYRVAGEQVEEPAGSDLRKAVQLRKRRLSEVKAGTWRPRWWSSATTVAAYAERWVEQRKARVRSWAIDERRLRLHALPALGERQIQSLTQADIIAWIDGMRSAQSAKTIKNNHGVLSAMLKDAVGEGIIEANPARDLPRGVLPRPAKRGRRPLTTAEILECIYDERVPPDRRILYALCALGGMREGEAAGRCWRDLTDAEPLARLHVHSQYQGEPLKGARDEDLADRMVPVHPELAEMLDGWRRVGWDAMYGRLPRPDDFITPDPRDVMKARTQNQIAKAFSRDTRGKLSLQLEHGVGLHSARRWMITQARQGGAPKDVLRRITHDPGGDILDLYTTYEWGPLCACVSAIQLPSAPADVVRLPKASGTNADEIADVAPHMATEVSEIIADSRWRRGESNPTAPTQKADSSGEVGPDRRIPVGHFPLISSAPTQKLIDISILRCPECGEALEGVECCGVVFGIAKETDHAR